jgi:hypothetical protein
VSITLPIPEQSVKLIAVREASNSAALDFTSLISATYDIYRFEFIGIIPVTSGARFILRVSTDNGASWVASADYGHAQFRWRAGATATSGAETGASAIDIVGDGISTSSAAQALNGYGLLYDPLNTSLNTIILGQVRFWNGSNRISSQWQGAYQQVTAVNAVRFLMSTGNISSGKILMYGCKGEL